MLQLEVQSRLLSFCRFALLLRFLRLCCLPSLAHLSWLALHNHATSAAVAEGLLATTRQFQLTQAGIGSTLDATLAKLFVEEDFVQPIARAGTERSLGSSSGLVESLPSSTAVGSDAIECLTMSGLHFEWHSYAVREVSLGAVLRSAPPASERAEVCRLQSVLGARCNLANQRWKEYIGEAAVMTAPSDMPGEAFFVSNSWEVRY